jgi:hypothetical protein
LSRLSATGLSRVTCTVRRLRVLHLSHLHRWEAEEAELEPLKTEAQKGRIIFFHAGSKCIRHVKTLVKLTSNKNVLNLSKL